MASKHICQQLKSEHINSFCYFVLLYRSNSCKWSKPNTSQNTITCIYTIWWWNAPNNDDFKKKHKTGQGWKHVELPMLIHLIYFSIIILQNGNKYFPFQYYLSIKRHLNTYFMHTRLCIKRYKVFHNIRTHCVSVTPLYFHYIFPIFTYKSFRYVRTWRQEFKFCSACIFTGYLMLTVFPYVG